MSPPKLRVQFPIELGTQVLGRLLAEFVREQPGLNIDLQLSDQLPGSRDKPVDVAIGIGPPAGAERPSRKIGSLGGGFYASPRYIEEHGEPQTEDALSAHACLSYHTQLQQGASRSEDIVSANNLTVLREAAICGLGIVQLPHILCSDAVNSGKLRRVLMTCDCAPLDLYASCPHSPDQALLAQRLLDHLDRRLKQLAATQPAS